MLGTHRPYIFGTAIPLLGRSLPTPSVRPPAESLAGQSSPSRPTASLVPLPPPPLPLPLSPDERASERASRAWEIHQIARMSKRPSLSLARPSHYSRVSLLATAESAANGDWPLRWRPWSFLFTMLAPPPQSRCMYSVGRPPSCHEMTIPCVARILFPLRSDLCPRGSPTHPSQPISYNAVDCDLFFCSHS